MSRYSGSGGLYYAAGSGAETIDASGATSANLLFGGVDASGHDSIAGGSGNDTMEAGAGSDTLIGGAGVGGAGSGGAGAHDTFVFLSANGGAAADDAVVNFNASDTVWLADYGSAAAPTALSEATYAGGSTTITLSDSTRITFVGIASASELQGHVISTPEPAAPPPSWRAKARHPRRGSRQGTSWMAGLRPA